MSDQFIGLKASKDEAFRQQIKQAIIKALREVEVAQNARIAKENCLMGEPVPDYWSRIRMENGKAVTASGVPVAYIIKLMAVGWTVERFVESESFNGLTRQDCYDALAWAGDRIG